MLPAGAYKRHGLEGADVTARAGPLASEPGYLSEGRRGVGLELAASVRRFPLAVALRKGASIRLWGAGRGVGTPRTRRGKDRTTRTNGVSETEAAPIASAGHAASTAMASGSTGYGVWCPVAAARVRAGAGRAASSPGFFVGSLAMVPARLDL